MSITQKPGHDGGQEQDEIDFEGPAVVAVVVFVAEAGQHAIGGDVVNKRIMAYN